jgi:uracil-DNA glycosylase family 4
MPTTLIVMDGKAPLAHCDACPLRDRPVVLGFGPEAADRVIVGEAPGEREVAEGRPFVGSAGRRLNKALVAKEVPRSTLYITNAVLCHPEGNESPPPLGAVKACHERLIAEIGLTQPRKVLALGKTASKALTGDPTSIEQLRLLDEAPSPYLGGDAKVRVTYHPSALNRRPGRSDNFDDDVGWLADD